MIATTIAIATFPFPKELCEKMWDTAFVYETNVPQPGLFDELPHVGAEGIGN